MINELQNRDNLCEGRSYGLGYSVLKFIDDDNFETYNAFTCCKDYLNDFVYVEQTGINIKQIYGFKHEYQEIFKTKKDYIYLGLTGLSPSKNNVSQYEKDVDKYLNKNYENIIENINYLESLLGKDKFTEFYSFDKITFYNKKKSKKALILQVPKYWISTPVSFSFYCLFIRFYLNVKEIKELNKLTKGDFLIKGDEYFLNTLTSISLLEDMNEIFSNYNFKERYKTKQSRDIHNFGIVSWLKKLPNEKFKKEYNKKTS